MSLNAVGREGEKQGERARLNPSVVGGYSNGATVAGADIEQPRYPLNAPVYLWPLMLSLAL